MKALIQIRKLMVNFGDWISFLSMAQAYSRVKRGGPYAAHGQRAHFLTEIEKEKAELRPGLRGHRCRATCFYRLVSSAAASAAAEATASATSRAAPTTTSAATAAGPATPAAIPTPVWTTIGASLRTTLGCPSSGKRRVPIEIGLVIGEIGAAFDSQCGSVSSLGAFRPRRFRPEAHLRPSLPAAP